MNPLFVQNTTFAWTKLPAAFLILLALYCYVEGVRRAEPRLRTLAAAGLGAAVLTHYSAGPYVLGLGLAHFALYRGRWGDGGFWRETAGLALTLGALPATWFGWSVAQFGAATTFGSNTTIMGNPRLAVSWWYKAAGNLYNTLVPHPLASEANGFLAQSSPWASWRDFFFNLYQVNLPWALGGVGCVVVVRALARAWRDGNAGVRGPVAAALALTAVAGVIVNGDLDPHGTAHVCLQPLVLGGAAVIAAGWPGLPAGWRRALALGWAFDFCAGIALHFANQGLLIDGWPHPNATPRQILATFSSVARINFNAKLYHQTVFLGEGYGLAAGPLLVLLAALLVWFVIQARAAKTASAAAKLVRPVPS
jgi:hypothetical protein